MTSGFLQLESTVEAIVDVYVCGRLHSTARGTKTERC
jgi:hypothetical protein